LNAGRTAAKKLEAWGFTSVHTMALEPNSFIWAMQELEARDELPLRVWACLPHADLEHVEALGLRGGTGNRVRLSGIKFFSDGALGSRTAWMLEPYLGTSETGVIADPPEAILERGRRALELGFCPVVHAIGDRANFEILNVLEQLKPLAEARGIRLRLEHAQHLHPDDIPRFGRLGVVASVQAIHLVDDAMPVYTLLGAERAKGMYAFRSLLETGATLAMGSDASVATPDPVLGMRAAVERIGSDGNVFMPDQCLTPLETLEAYTLGAAKAAGWERWYGRIAPGCAAEFTLWDADPSKQLANPIRAWRQTFNA
jgi:predicted amidohydrolase YtcJ